MDAKIIYDKINSDFIKDNMSDDWSFMKNNEFITESFIKTGIGLVADNTKTINKVFIVTFPDTQLLDNIISNNADVLIFSHHAMSWDSSDRDFPFYDIPVEIFRKMKEKRISFYVLHAPLDANGEYSTSVGLMHALRLKKKDEFFLYNGSKSGMLCTTDYTSGDSFAKFMEQRFGHQVKYFNNGDDFIKNGEIALVAGGGGLPSVIEELKDLGVTLYITGVTRKVKSYQPSLDFHILAEKYRINIIAGTHYSTEKWACMNMLDYFRRSGLGAVFLPGKYNLSDY